MAQRFTIAVDTDTHRKMIAIKAKTGRSLSSQAEEEIRKAARREVSALGITDADVTKAVAEYEREERTTTRRKAG